MDVQGMIFFQFEIRIFGSEKKWRRNSQKSGKIGKEIQICSDWAPKVQTVMLEKTQNVGHAGRKPVMA